MKPSRSPSSTPVTLPTSWSVRRSFTSWYGCSTYERIWLPQPTWAWRPPAILCSSASRSSSAWAARMAFSFGHRLGPVLELAALVLAGDHHAGREVGDADGRRRLVDVLATGARRAVGVDPEVLVVDLDARRCRRATGTPRRRRSCVWRRALPSNGLMRTRRCVPRSALHEAVGVAAPDGELGRQDAGLGALGDVVDLDVEAPTLGPAGVHAQQHLGPVLGVDAAVLGVDGADGVGLVVLAGEEAAQLELVELGVERRRRPPRSRAPGSRRPPRGPAREHLGVLDLAGRGRRRRRGRRGPGRRRR